ncbi:hypothetical protein [Terasakiella pusilla]|uniref:hypothetical protein n=1 Tax=Terasakiella pusilla TaxID=64973 RepID=UPI003AA99044
MRTVLVSIVIGMGLLIVLGLVALVYGLIQKADNPDFKFFDLSKNTPGIEEAIKDVEVPLVGNKSSQPQNNVAAPAPVKAFGDMRLEIPQGYKVVETDLDSQRLVLRLINDAGINKLMVLDINTGAKLGGLSLHPAQ